MLSVLMTPGGSIKVRCTDAEGHDLATSEAVSKTVTDEPLKWSMSIDTEMIQLTFEIVNAKLYSFSFADM